MKWYKHDPNAALAGMIGLTVEERGAYYTLIDLYYARAPHSHVDDEHVVKALAVRPQMWRRLKAALIAKGKVREVDGHLTANRVETTVETAVKLMRNLSHIGAVSELRTNEIKHLARERHNFSYPKNQNQISKEEDLSFLVGREMTAEEFMTMKQRRAPLPVSVKQRGNR